MVKKHLGFNYTIKVLFVCLFSFGVFCALRWYQAVYGVLLISLTFFLMSVLYSSKLPIRAVYQNTPRSYRRFFLGFIAVILLAQVVKMDNAFFPFVRFDMYSKQEQSTEVITFKYFSKIDHNKYLELPVTRLIRTLANGRFQLGFERKLSGFLSGEYSSSEREEIDATLKGVIELYNLQNPFAPIDNIVVTLKRFDTGKQSELISSVPIYSTQL